MDQFYVLTFFIFKAAQNMSVPACPLPVADKACVILWLISKGDSSVATLLELKVKPLAICQQYHIFYNVLTVCSV
jgi:hypothetical protein